MHPEMDAPPPRRGNGMGIAGFVIALIGVFTCFTLSPIGLLFGLIGLRRAPRGLAIAGTIIGGLGSIALIFMVTVGYPYGYTAFQLGMAKAKIETHLKQHGSPPDDEESVELLDGVQDGWKRPFRYKRIGATYELRSAGPDGVFDNEDDLHDR